jgi:hypothetical protein
MSSLPTIYLQELGLRTCMKMLTYMAALSIYISLCNFGFLKFHMFMANGCSDHIT